MKKIKELSTFWALQVVGDEYTKKRQLVRQDVIQKIQNSVFIYNSVIRMKNGEIDLKKLEETIKQWE